jgi:hypothetical protein
MCGQAARRATGNQGGSAKEMFFACVRSGFIAAASEEIAANVANRVKSGSDFGGNSALHALFDCIRKDNRKRGRPALRHGDSTR